MSAATAMYDMLKLFSIGRSHMVVLVQPNEEQLEEILDEVAPDRWALPNFLKSRIPGSGVCVVVGRGHTARSAVQAAHGLGAWLAVAVGPRAWPKGMGWAGGLRATPGPHGSERSCGVAR